MPFMAMVASVGSNDQPDMYNYLGGVKNSKRSEELDAAFKQNKSNFHIAVVVDMWITGFDVPSLTYMYNDKPLKKHLLIQTISRVNRKYPGKDYGFIIDYIGIRENMREAMKIYGGDNSVAPTTDDVEQATSVFREELVILKDLFSGYDLAPFLDPNGDPSLRYRVLAKAAEYVFISTQELQTESKGGKSVEKVSFKTYFLKTVKRMRAAYDICQPSGELGDGITVNDKCKALAKKIKEIIDTKSSFADWLNNQIVRDQLKFDIKVCLIKNGYPPQYSPEVFRKVM